MRRQSTCLIMAAALWLVGAPAGAEDFKETDVFVIARGGLLYDNWYAVLEQDPPTATHPAYPAAGKKSGAATWRCKECHGWDYKGADGAYGQGSHFTGIPGIRDRADADPAAIAAIVRDDTHGFSAAMIPAKALDKLALFVSRGQLDMDRHIDPATKKARGSTTRGARLYQTICAVCHGFDGRAIQFSDEDKPEFIGTVAQENPWETLHKIRNGQPGVGMVALRALGVQDQVDILAYAQTLPAE